MALHKVLNYGRTRWVVHYARATRPELAARMNAEDVKAEDWHFWRSLCGKELIAHASEDYEVDCKACVKAYEKGQRQAAELVERFG